MVFTTLGLVIQKSLALLSYTYLSLGLGTGQESCLGRNIKTVDGGEGGGANDKQRLHVLPAARFFRPICDQINRVLLYKYL